MKTATFVRNVSAHSDKDGWVMFDLYKLSEPWLGNGFAVVRTSSRKEWGTETAIYPCDESCMNYAGYLVTIPNLRPWAALELAGYTEVFK